MNSQEAAYLSNMIASDPRSQFAFGAGAGSSAQAADIQARLLLSQQSQLHMQQLKPQSQSLVFTPQIDYTKLFNQNNYGLSMNPLVNSNEFLVAALAAQKQAQQQQQLLSQQMSAQIFNMALQQQQQSQQSLQQQQQQQQQAFLLQSQPQQLQQHSQLALLSMPGNAQAQQILSDMIQSSGGGEDSAKQQAVAAAILQIQQSQQQQQQQQQLSMAQQQSGMLLTNPAGVFGLRLGGANAVGQQSMTPALFSGMNAMGIINSSLCNNNSNNNNKNEQFNQLQLGEQQVGILAPGTQLQQQQQQQQQQQALFLQQQQQQLQQIFQQQQQQQHPAGTSNSLSHPLLVSQQHQPQSQQLLLNSIAQPIIEQLQVVPLLQPSSQVLSGESLNFPQTSTPSCVVNREINNQNNMDVSGKLLSKQVQMTLEGSLNMKNSDPYATQVQGESIQKIHGANLAVENVMIEEEEEEEQNEIHGDGVEHMIRLQEPYEEASRKEEGILNQQYSDEQNSLQYQSKVSTGKHLHLEDFSQGELAKNRPLISQSAGKREGSNESKAVNQTKRAIEIDIAKVAPVAADNTGSHTGQIENEICGRRKNTFEENTAAASSELDSGACSTNGSVKRSSKSTNITPGESESLKEQEFLRVERVQEQQLQSNHENDSSINSSESHDIISIDDESASKHSRKQTKRSSRRRTNRRISKKAISTKGTPQSNRASATVIELKKQQKHNNRRSLDSKKDVAESEAGFRRSSRRSIQSKVEIEVSHESIEEEQQDQEEVVKKDIGEDSREEKEKENHSIDVEMEVERIDNMTKQSLKKGEEIAAGDMNVRNAVDRLNGVCCENLFCLRGENASDSNRDSHQTQGSNARRSKRRIMKTASKRFASKVYELCEKCTTCFRKNLHCDYCEQVYENSECCADGKEWVGCDSCSKWNHILCEAAYSKDQSIKEKYEQEDFMYFCLPCRGKHVSIVKSKTQIKVGGCSSSLVPFVPAMNKVNCAVSEVVSLVASVESEKSVQSLAVLPTNGSVSEAVAGAAGNQNEDCSVNFNKLVQPRMQQVKMRVSEELGVYDIGLAAERIREMRQSPTKSTDEISGNRCSGFTNQQWKEYMQQAHLFSSCNNHNNSSYYPMIEQSQSRSNLSENPLFAHSMLFQQVDVSLNLNEEEVQYDLRRLRELISIDSPSTTTTFSLVGQDQQSQSILNNNLSSLSTFECLQQIFQSAGSGNQENSLREDGKGLACGERSTGFRSGRLAARASLAATISGNDRSCPANGFGLFKPKGPSQQQGGQAMMQSNNNALVNKATTTRSGRIAKSVKNS